MIQAMYAGISGMKAFKSSLDVIGNNIANVNTTGFKSGKMQFKEMLSQTIQSPSGPTGNLGGKNPSQIGLGTVVGAVVTNISQGSMLATGRKTDCAIEGNGVFAVGGGDRIYYTRDGGFSLDAQYNLVSSATGYKVLGWSADTRTGSIDTTAPVTGSSGIQIPIGSLSIARATSSIEIGGNLNAASNPPATPPQEVTDVEFEFFDSLGKSHEITIRWSKLATNAGPPPRDEWQYDVMIPDDIAPANPMATGVVQFDENGFSLTDSVNISVDFDAVNGATDPQTVTLDFSKITQLKGPINSDGTPQHTIGLQYQDGLEMGTLESFSISRSGMISGTFTNGSVRSLGQVALAEFNNYEGLTKIGNNLLSESPNSGAAKIGIPGDGSLGQLAAGFLEGSNVDLANEFADMIVAQRGFQANSRIISVSDEVLMELVNLKR